MVQWIAKDCNLYHMLIWMNAHDVNNANHNYSRRNNNWRGRLRRRCSQLF